MSPSTRAPEAKPIDRDLASPSQTVGGGVPLAVACAALLMGVALLYGRVVVRLFGDWWDDANYSHGFLVPILSAYLVWRQREALAALPRGASAIGLPVLLTGLFMLVLGEVGAERFL